MTTSALAVLKRLYRPLYLIETPVLARRIETAELIKYAANAFLATKITFINEIADLCEKVGADVHDVARGMGLDGRIGRKFLHPGPGYGGSCFPKDTLALARTAQDAGAPIRLVEATIAVNEARKAQMADRILAACGGFAGGQDGRRAGRDLQAQDRRHARRAIAGHPAGAGRGRARRCAPSTRSRAMRARRCRPRSASPRPPGRGQGRRRGGGADRMERVPRAVARAPEGRHAGDVVLDLRNVCDPAAMRAAGFAYSSIGRP